MKTIQNHTLVSSSITFLLNFSRRVSSNDFSHSSSLPLKYMSLWIASLTSPYLSPVTPFKFFGRFVKKCHSQNLKLQPGNTIFKAFSNASSIGLFAAACWVGEKVSRWMIAQQVVFFTLGSWIAAGGPAWNMSEIWRSGRLLSNPAIGLLSKICLEHNLCDEVQRY